MPPSGSASIGAGWSSPVARQAHNLKVVGSNPTPATTSIERPLATRRGAFVVSAKLIKVAVEASISTVFEPSAEFSTVTLPIRLRSAWMFSKGGRRLVRTAVKDDSNRATMELRGLQALIAKAGTPACRAEARTASISYS